MKYSEIRKEIDKNYKHDTNFCTVVASSVAFDLPFNLVHKLYSEHGRKLRTGLMPDKTDEMILKLAEITGYKVSCFSLDRKHKYLTGFSRWVDNKGEILTQLRHNLTPNNAETYLPLGNYILGVRRHVLGVENGIVQDWTQGKKHKINRVWKIEI